MPSPQESSPNILVQTHPKNTAEIIREAALACALGRHRYLPGTGMTPLQQLSVHHKLMARDSRTESSSTLPHGKLTNASHQSKQLLAWLHCPTSLAESWPRKKGCREEKLKGKLLQLSGRARYAKGCSDLPRPGIAGQGSKSPFTGATPHMLEAIWLLQAGSKGTTPTTFPFHPAHLSLWKTHSSSPGPIPQPST